MNGVGKVVKLNRKVSTRLAKILDRPTCWRSTKLTIGAINVSASFKQQMHDLTMAVQRRIVEGCGA